MARPGVPPEIVGRLSHVDDGRVIIGWDDRMWDVADSRVYAGKDENGMIEINHVRGKYESAVGVPWKLRAFINMIADEAEAELVIVEAGGVEDKTQLALPVTDIVAEWKLDNAKARTIPWTDEQGVSHTGIFRDLQIFWTMLGKHHTEGWFGRGRFRLLLILIGVMGVGIMVTGVAGSYFASQPHYVYECAAGTIQGSNATAWVPCLGSAGGAPGTVATTTASVTVHTISVGAGH